MRTVQDLNVLTQPGKDELGLGTLTFSDRYHILGFEMPDLIPGKGKSLALTAAHSFERAAEAELPTHYRGLRSHDGVMGLTTDPKVVSVGSVPNQMFIYVANMIKPTIMRLEEEEPSVLSHEAQFTNPITYFEYSYAEFAEKRGRLNNFLIPLECIYRNGVPEGSSLLVRIEEARKRGDKVFIDDILQKTGLSSVDELVPGVMFKTPYYEFTTKFEQSDRYVSDDEAFRISGLDRRSFNMLVDRRNKARDVIGDIAEKAGFVDYDGKVEFLFFERFGPVLCNLLGTFDDNRFMFKEAQVSEEVLRQWYIKTQPKWVDAVYKAREEGRSKGIEEWQSLCKVQPNPLPQGLVNLVGRMYLTGAQLFTGIDIGSESDLGRIMDNIREFKE